MANKKRRVRKHIIADLSVNHVEYQLLKAGYTMETVKKDYGYDGTILTFDSNGEPENGNILVQLKATDSISRHRKYSWHSFQVSKKDITLWYGEPFPVYLVLFDAVRERAYWLYVQRYLSAIKKTPSRIKGKSLVMRIDIKNTYTAKTPRVWNLHKEKVLNQLRGLITYA